MISQDEYAKAHAATQQALTAIRFRREDMIKPSGIACACGKELTEDRGNLYQDCGFHPELRCDCGKRGYFNSFNSKFVWLE